MDCILRTLAAIAAVATAPILGRAQLLSETGPHKVVQAAEVPPKLTGQASLHFLRLDVNFTAGDHVALFRRGDGGFLRLYFPHPLYWSDEARKAPAQPVAIPVTRDGDRVLVEVVPSSPLEDRIVELLSRDLASGNHTAADSNTLTQIRNCIRSRQPLHEMQAMIDFWINVFRDPGNAPAGAQDLLDAWSRRREAELSHATEPATESVPKNESSPPAR